MRETSYTVLAICPRRIHCIYYHTMQTSFFYCKYFAGHPQRFVFCVSPRLDIQGLIRALVLIRSPLPSTEYPGMVSNHGLLAWFFSYARETPALHLHLYLCSTLHHFSLPSLDLCASIVGATSNSNVLDAMKMTSEQGGPGTWDCSFALERCECDGYREGEREMNERHANSSSPASAGRRAISEQSDAEHAFASIHRQDQSAPSFASRLCVDVPQLRYRPRTARPMARINSLVSNNQHLQLFDRVISTVYSILPTSRSHAIQKLLASEHDPLFIDRRCIGDLLSLYTANRLFVIKESAGLASPVLSATCRSTVS